MSRKAKVAEWQGGLDFGPVEWAREKVGGPAVAEVFDETAAARKREASGDSRVLKVRRDLKKEYELRLSREALCYEPLPEPVCRNIEEARDMLRLLARFARYNPAIADALATAFPDLAKFDFVQLDVVLDQAMNWVRASRINRDRRSNWQKWRRRMSVPEGFVAVAGDTYPVRTYLRNIGGRWDAKDGCWYVPQKKLRAALLAVNNPNFYGDEEAINERIGVRDDAADV